MMRAAATAALLAVALGPHGSARAQQMVSPQEVQRTLDDLERYYKAHPARRPGSTLPPEALPVQLPAACAPRYPKDAIRMQWQGSMELKFLVHTDGTVLAVEIKRSSSFPLLDEAGVAAIRACTLSPFLRNGKPIQQWATTGYTWSLKDVPAQ